MSRKSSNKEPVSLQNFASLLSKNSKISMNEQMKLKSILNLSKLASKLAKTKNMSISDAIRKRKSLHELV